MRRFSVASLASLAALISGLLLASPAAAFHIPGAPYSGPVSGGGTITFSVSPDGSSVTDLSLNGPIDGDTCTLNFAHYLNPAPITNNSFNAIGEVSGTFSSIQHAQGTINITESFGFGDFCHISQSWTAATGASPTGSAECQAAIANVNSVKQQLKKAKKTGNKKKVKKLKKKLAEANNAKSQFCG